MVLSSLSATEASFLMVALCQGVASLVWAAAAWAVDDARRPATHWAVWAALSSVTWFILATHLASPPVIGVLCGVLGAIVLQRGIRVFIGRRFVVWPPVLMLAAVLAADVLAASPERRHLQAVVNFGTLALLYAGIGADLYAHARSGLRLRWPVLLALPALIGAAAFAARALRALMSPESVASEMATHSTLNVGSAFSYLVLVLMLHATLLALVAGRLVTHLRRLSRHDGLTGLLNRRAVEEALAEQLSHSLRSGEVFSVMMLDVDHFKSINDRHGHAAGDLALKRVAAQLRGGLREIDRLGRFGGEEFLLVLPGLSVAQALPMAERLRADVAAQPVAATGGASIALSVSIGVAGWDGGEGDAERLLARADAALFEAKAAGRNRVAGVALSRSGQPQAATA